MRVLEEISMRKYFYEIDYNKKLSFGAIQAASIQEARERFSQEIANGTLLRLETDNGIVIFEKQKEEK